MTKSTVSKDYSSSKYSQAELAVKGDKIVDMMTGNPNFPEPSPTLETLSADLSAYKQALEKADGGTRIDTVDKNNKKATLIGTLKSLALYVEKASNGDKKTILTSGFNVNGKAEPVGPLPQAENLKIKMGVNQGSVILSCKAIKHARVYVFEYTPTPMTDESVWTKLTSTKHQLQIDGLKSGAEYAFRAAGAGSDPSRNWSKAEMSYIL